MPNSDSDPLNDSRLTADVSGPSKAPLLRTPVFQGGARLSKRFKGAAFILIGVVVAAVLIGIVTSGNDGSTPDAKKGSEASGAGSVNPDTGAMERAANEMKLKELANSFQTTPQVQNGANGVTPKVIGGVSVPASAGNVSAQGAGGVKTPAENFQAWQEEQHFKAEEARFTASQNAKSSGTQISITAQASKAAATDIQAPIKSTTTTTDDPTRLNSLAAEVARSSASSANGGAGPNGVFPQSQNTSFLNDQKKAESGYLNSVLNNPLNQTELFAGSVIPAVTTVGINSDLPGQVNATVRQTVYDSRNENIVLIPQGTKIVGQYSSSVSYGQQRVLIAWNQLIFPNGKTIGLQGMLGADGLGQSGLYDSVDNHYFKIFGSALLVSMLGVAAQLSQPQNSSLLASPSVGSQASGSAAAQLNTVGTNMVNKNLNIAPTLVIAPGFAFNVLVNKTMILPAYK